MSFGRKMLEFRAKHNLTQNQLAQILGVALNTVHKSECEKTNPSRRNEIVFENKMKEWEKNKNENV